MKGIALHLGLLALLFGLHFVLPDYHHGNLARVMVLAAFAMGYNILFGYTGLLSLGHALFFAAGMYGTGLAVQHLGWGAGPALVTGLAAGAVVESICISSKRLRFMSRRVIPEVLAMDRVPCF